MTYQIKYRKEEEMSDSGIEWLGMVPKEWSILNIGHIGRLSTSSVNKKIEKHEKEVNLLNFLDIYNSKGKTISNDIDFMKVTAKQGQLKSSQIEKGDVYFTPSSETIEDIGHSAVVIEDIKNTLFSYHIVRLVFNRKINIGFKKYIFNNYFVLNQLSKKASGTTRKTLNMNDFKYTDILLPLKDEQQKIANFLDSKTSEIDSIISKKERLIKKLEESKKSLISEVVTGKVKIVDGEIVERQATEMKDSGVEWLGMIPKDWEVAKAKYFADVFIPQRNKPELNSYEGIPWVTIENIKGIYLKYKDDKAYVSKSAIKASGSKILNANSVITSCIGSFGISSINKEDVIINQQLQAFTNIDINVEYFNFYIESAGSYFDSISTATTLKYVNKDKFENIKAVIPTKKEQNNIVEILNKKTTDLNSIIKKTNLQIQKLKQAKQSLISEAVTGKINLSDWEII